MASIEGRNSDFLVTRSGRVIHGESISHIVRNLDGVRQFQLRQHQPDSLTLFLSVDSGWEQSSVELIRRKIETLFGHTLDLQINYTDRIVPSPSGKHRFVISEIGGQYWEEKAGSVEEKASQTQSNG